MLFFVVLDVCVFVLYLLVDVLLWFVDEGIYWFLWLEDILVEIW